MTALLRHAILATSLVISGCSFLLEVDGKQCRADSECVQSGLGVTCDRGVCASSREKLTTGSCGSVPPCAETETCFKEQCASSSQVQPFLCERPGGDPSTGVSLTMHVRDYIANTPVSGL